MKSSIQSFVRRATLTRTFAIVARPRGESLFALPRRGWAAGTVFRGDREGNPRRAGRVARAADLHAKRRKSSLRDAKPGTHRAADRGDFGIPRQFARSKVTPRNAQRIIGALMARPAIGIVSVRRTAI